MGEATVVTGRGADRQVGRRHNPLCKINTFVNTKVNEQINTYNKIAYVNKAKSNR